jgi:hypothetical protein
MIKYSTLIKEEKKMFLYGIYINHKIKKVVGISFEKYCKEYIKALL